MILEIVRVQLEQIIVAHVRCPESLEQLHAS